MRKLRFKHNTTGQTAFDYIGRVSYRAEIAVSERSDTDDCKPISIHTARSYVNDRPDAFMFMMADTGARGFETGQNGESILLDFRAFFEEYAARHPDTAEADLSLLTSVPYPYRPWYFHGAGISQEPVLRRVADTFQVRFWNEIETPAALCCVGSRAKDLQPVLERMCADIRCSAALKVFQMEPGDIYVIDNHRVGHGRYGFLGSVVRDAVRQNSSRLAYSLHVQHFEGVR